MNHADEMNTLPLRVRIRVSLPDVLRPATAPEEPEVADARNQRTRPLRPHTDDKVPL